MDRTGKEHAEPLLADIAELKAVAAMLFVAGTYGFLDWKWRDDEREPHSLVPPLPVRSCPARPRVRVYRSAQTTT
jgi:hypothetical protein